MPFNAGVYVTKLPDKAYLLARRRIVGSCWVWTGARSSGGYGNLSFGGKYHTPHRVAYHLWVGPIPRKLVIDHLCRVRLCFRPSHLEVTTHRTNILRGTGFSARLALRDRCVNGHKFDPLVRNRWTKSPHARLCRQCRREIEQRRRDRLKARGISARSGKGYVRGPYKPLDHAYTRGGLRDVEAA